VNKAITIFRVRWNHRSAGEPQAKNSIAKFNKSNRELMIFQQSLSSQIKNKYCFCYLSYSMRSFILNYNKLAIFATVIEHQRS